MQSLAGYHIPIAVHPKQRRWRLSGRHSAIMGTRPGPTLPLGSDPLLRRRQPQQPAKSTVPHLQCSRPRPDDQRHPPTHRLPRHRPRRLPCRRPPYRPM